MNRAQKRALRFFGRRKAKQQGEAERNAVEAELRARLEALEAKHDAVPGVREERKDWFVLVGGERVEIRALPAIEWVRAQQELPAFLFTFTTDRLSTGTLSDELIAQIDDLAKRWIAASAVKPDELHLDRLSFPEAEHAVAHIATLNGVTDALRAWFRQRLTGVADAAPNRQGVRGQAEQPPGSALN